MTERDNADLYRKFLVETILKYNLPLTEFTEKCQVCGVFVVQPGMATTCEFRGDNIRFFPELDKFGNVIGGNFS